MRTRAAHSNQYKLSPSLSLSLSLLLFLFLYLTCVPCGGGRYWQRRNECTRAAHSNRCTHTHSLSHTPVCTLRKRLIFAKAPYVYSRSSFESIQTLSLSVSLSLSLALSLPRGGGRYLSGQYIVTRTVHSNLYTHYLSLRHTHVCTLRRRHIFAKAP